MAEILTESFCERCGSRYTFESAVPRARLRGVKVLSRGFKNFVLDDKTSIDEAMAAARDDTDRDLTSQQLDAFHKTFNFCMQCRQYICPNCWNDADGRCLTCAPMLGHNILPAPFPRLDPSAGIAAPDDNGLAAAAMSDHKHASDEPNGVNALARLDALTPVATPTPPTTEMIGASEVEAQTEAADAVAAETAEAATHADAGDESFVAPEASTVADATGSEAATPSEPEAFVADQAAATEILSHADTLEAVPEALLEADQPEAPALEAPAEAEAEAVSAFETPAVDPETVVEPAAEAAFEEAVATPEAAAPFEEAVATPESVATPEADDAGEVAAAATDTSLLLEGLKPGQSLDDAIAAFESQPAIAAELEAAQPAPVEAEPEPVAAAIDLLGTDEPSVALETPALVVEPEDTPSIPADVVALADVADATDSIGATWAADEEPLVDALVADAAQPEPASYVEPLDEIPAAEAVEAEPTVEAATAEATIETVEAQSDIEPPTQPEDAWLAEPVVVQLVAEALPEAAEPALPEASEIAAAATPVDVVDQPKWSVVAPAPATTDGVPAPIAEPPAEPPSPIAARPVERAPEPSWPAQPQWPAPQAGSGLPFLGRPAVPTGGVEALWAESDRAVSAPRVGADKPTGGVQPCVSCGLSLSASARFCRRCGTSQVG